MNIEKGMLIKCIYSEDSWLSLDNKAQGNLPLETIGLEAISQYEVEQIGIVCDIYDCLDCVGQPSNIFLCFMQESALYKLALVTEIEPA